MKISKITPKEKTSLSVEIESELLKEVKQAAKQRGLKLRDIVELGLREFLEELKNETSAK